jgi:hypothetical protein
MERGKEGKYDGCTLHIHVKIYQQKWFKLFKGGRR